MAARGVLYFLLLALSSGVYGQDVTETKLTTFDWAAGDALGSSVAISGGYAVAGAPDDDDNGSNSGSAYIFERDGGGNWNEVQKLTASDGAENDRFGYSVAISGDYAVISAGGDDDNGTDSGSAYVYERDGQGNWSEAAKLIASDGAGYDNFGRSVSISGDDAVIGASGHGANNDTDSNSGSAYIFERNRAGQWSQVQKLTASDGDAHDQFGSSVSISGDYAVVGAPFHDDNGSNSGSAYVFKRDGTGSWIEVQKLMAQDGAVNDRFGYSVSIAGDDAVIGAYLDDDNGQQASGSAYIFDRLGSDLYLQVQKLTASDGAPGDYFGYSVSLSDGYAVIGAYGDYTVIGPWEEQNVIQAGSAYVFERDGVFGNWNEVTKLTASDGDAGDYFGGSVAISGGYAVIGAERDDDKGTNSGSAYIFDRDGDGDWIQSAKQTAPADKVSYDKFGFSVSIAGDYAIVSAPLDDENGYNTGSVYFFERDGLGNWHEAAKLMASDGMVSDALGTCVSISGNYAVVGAEGDDDNGSLSGSAYVFERDGDGNWSEAAKLTASDGAEGDWFGYSVSISGGYAVIGAIYDNDSGDRSGSAYVYERDGQGNWSEVAKLTASDAAEEVHFGIVAISGGYAVVGAYLDDDNGQQASGSAYVFERDGAGVWSEVQKLTASDGASEDQFGRSVSISGDYAVIGALGDDDNGSVSGSAYVFERDGDGNWSEAAKLTASDGAEGDWFGYSVSISGGYAVVGAEHDDDNGSNSGSAYVFQRSRAGNWVQVQKLTASDGAAGDYFGRERAVSISGNYAVVGADGDDDNGSSSGSAYIYQIEPAPVCPGDATGDLVVNLADFSQLLVDFGSTSGSAADFNGDNIVDLADFSILLVNFGNDCNAPLRAAPAGGSKKSAWPGPVNESARHFSPIKKKKP